MLSTRYNLFFLSLLLFSAALPLSAGAISVAGGVAVLAAIASQKAGQKPEPVRSRICYWFPVTVFTLQLVGLVFTSNTAGALYDLKKAAPFLLMPLAFFVAPPLTSIQRTTILKLFAGAVIVSAGLTMVQYYRSGSTTILNTQFAGFIHHIRFSLMVLFAIVVIAGVAVARETGRVARGGAITAIAFLLFFLVWHQSLTGLSTFIGIVFIVSVYFSFKLKPLKYRLALLVVLVVVTAIPAGTVYRVVREFYSVDPVDVATLPAQTAQGHPYTHDWSDRLTENGHYIGLYMSEAELREAWNRRSAVGFDSLTPEGYKVGDTVIRYLTSLNLPKDAAGVRALSAQDIVRIENGVANYRLGSNHFSLYPRLYVTIWEIDRYLKSGNSENKSVAQRLEYLRAAWKVWTQHFWFGVGPGNWKQAYADAYQSMGSAMKPEQYADAHNQYLAWLARLGLIGTSAILFSLIFPVWSTGAWKNPYGALFILIVAIGNLGDSNLDTHSGAWFFIFFYCLLLMPQTAGRSGLCSGDTGLATGDANRV